MKETVFILFVIAVLFALTAIRYRRQIVAFISFYKQLKAVRTNLRNGEREHRRTEISGIQLVKCSRCGKWIPETEVAANGGRAVCRSACVVTKATRST